jgi:hypothetical protein
MRIQVWIAEMAANFWASAGEEEPFPRNLRRPIARAVSLTVVSLPKLTIGSMIRWLRDCGIICDIESPDRPLRACLVARNGHGFAFIDGSDGEAEQRFSLAHELAHFLRHYLHVRRQVSRRLGPAALEVLDGERPATLEERLHALVRNSRIGFHIHLMDRDREGFFTTDAVGEAEDDADRLAFELLAPAEHVTYELMTGGGNPDLMVAATNVLRELVETHEKFVFVASEPRDRMLLTIAQALRPLEYAIVSTLDERLEDWIHQRRFAVGVSRKFAWDGKMIAAAEWIPRFIHNVASKIVVGLFRATRFAPAQVFYAHVDHADLAAHLVLADSVLLEHRGFPMLAYMANDLCDSVFGDSLEGLVETAYAAAGVPWRYTNQKPRRTH